MASQKAVKKVRKAETKEVAALPMSSYHDKDREPGDYEIKDWADTIHRAHEILKDKKKMKHVERHMETRHKAMKKMKSLAQVKASAEAGEEY